jgi:hypothetical protein
MTLRAMAFHNAISYDRLEELFKSETNQMFATSLAGACPHCKLKFAVFFPVKDDPRNPEFLAKMNELIGKNCDKGKHGGEYVFTTTP